jgi:hypothetical protein
MLFLLPYPFLQQAYSQIFQDDLTVCILLLGYLPTAAKKKLIIIRRGKWIFCKNNFLAVKSGVFVIGLTSVWTEMVKLVSCLVVLLAASVAPQRKFRLFNALFTDCGNFF